MSGTITSSDVDIWKRDSKTHYQAYIAYTYSVDGKKYSSSKINAGEPPMDNNVNPAKKIQLFENYKKKSGIKPKKINKMGNRYITQSIILGFFIGSLLLASCSKEDELLFETPYKGVLKVDYFNTYPPWDVSAEMEFTMDQNGVITIMTEALSYSGELILEDSKIIRSGTWLLRPEGYYDNSNSTIVVNPNIEVSNDLTEVWAIDNYGNWVKVSKDIPYNGQVGGPVTFGFMMVTTSPVGSVQTVSDGTGSITWTLSLI